MNKKQQTSFQNRKCHTALCPAAVSAAGDRFFGAAALSLCIALYSRGIFSRLQQGDVCRTHPAVEPVN